MSLRDRGNPRRKRLRNERPRCDGVTRRRDLQELLGTEQSCAVQYTVLAAGCKLEQRKETVKDTRHFFLRENWTQKCLGSSRLCTVKRMICSLNED